MRFFKSHWSNIVFLLLIALLLIPQTRKPFQVMVNRIFAFSPSHISEEERLTISDYNWILQDLEGERLNFNETEGKIAIVNLWATWCPPCIAEMPSFEALFEDFGQKVDFFFVSNEETEKLQNFLDQKDYSLPVYTPLSRAPSELQSVSLPTTYLIAENGQIVIKKVGAANWNAENVRELILELLNE